jgi:TetR/AcrR family transcriptional repressor of nem operon
MPRTKEFEREEALEAALDTFWEKGFECTSMQTLVERMGIGRASLYDTFGSKEALFEEAMERYEQRLTEEVLGPLLREGPVRKLLAAFFQRMVDCHSSGEVRPCLLVKTALIHAQEDRRTAERVKRFTEQMDGAFYHLLVRGREAGEIEQGRNLRDLARFLTSTVQGLNVAASIRPDRKILQSIVRTALAILD